jgi:hypothetical protein
MVLPILATGGEHPEERSARPRTITPVADAQKLAQALMRSPAVSSLIRDITSSSPASARIRVSLITLARSRGLPIYKPIAECPCDLVGGGAPTLARLASLAAGGGGVWRHSLPNPLLRA